MVGFRTFDLPPGRGMCGVVLCVLEILSAGLLSCCATDYESMQSAAQFIWPDELTTEYGQGRSRGELGDPNWGLSEDSSYWSAGLTWYIGGPREVRVLDDARVPRAWYEREPPKKDEASLQTDESGNLSVKLPLAAALTVVASLLGWGGYRKYSKGKEEG